MQTIRSKVRNRVEAFRSDRRFESRNRQRANIANIKIHTGPVTIKQIEAIAQEIKQKKKDELSYQMLCNGLSQGEEEIEAFLKVDGALAALIGIWTGKDTEFQYHAGNCLVNLSAGSPKSSFHVTKAVSAYMMTYLASGSPVLQEISATTLGNLAFDGGKSWNILEKQGLLGSLFRILEDNPVLQYDVDPTIVECACYALTCIVRNPTFQTKLAFSTDKIRSITDLMGLSLHENIRKRSCELMYEISFEQESLEYLLQNEVLENIVDAILLEASITDVRDEKYVMMLTRMLGNLSSVDDKLIVGVLSPRHFQCTYVLLHHKFLVKEVLWVLANLAASKGTSKMFFAEEQLIPKIVSFADEFGDVADQALLCCCHLVSQDTISIQKLLQSGILMKLANALRRPDVIQKALTLLTLMSPQITEDAVCTLQSDETEVEGSTDDSSSKEEIPAPLPTQAISVFEMLKSSGCYEQLQKLPLEENDCYRDVILFLKDKWQLS